MREMHAECNDATHLEHELLLLTHFLLEDLWELQAPNVNTVALVRELSHFRGFTVAQREAICSRVFSIRDVFICSQYLLTLVV